MPVSKGPLEGVRVIELGQLIAGPWAGHLMADFGADVIKVEPPQSGDPLRQWGQHRYEDRTLWWSLMSRNKRSITLDLSQVNGQNLIKQLVEKADVLIENFRPGVLEGWGLAPEELHGINRGLIIARVSGFGQTGPYSRRPGYASIGEAMGGLRYINGYPGEPPPRMGISLGDPLAGFFALIGVLMALHWRDNEGRGTGQVVDASIFESCFAMLESAVPEFDKLGAVREPGGTRLKNVVPSNIFRTKDEKWVVIAANSEGMFQRLCVAIDRPELSVDERFRDHRRRGENAEALDAIIATWACELRAEEIDRALTDAGVACGGIYTIADIFADPQFAARQMIIHIQDRFFGRLAQPGLIPKLDETPGGVRWTGPELGAHNTEVYCDLLGLGAADLQRLSELGVI